ncbi:MAG: tripartite tricarboxylate transporter substrate-binding protein [Polynucleobacter sp.]|nr:tripartite tricarboxylate transporter substrate-binding protein [Polynucleobacter sp.]
MKKIIIAAATFALASSFAVANTFPNKSITLVVPFSAGGPTDVVARNLAIAMSKNLNQTVIVENKASAGGIVGSEAVIRAPADGHTLLIHNIGMSTLPSLSKTLRFDPRKDFSYIGEVVDVPMVLTGKKDLSPNNFPELVTYLKANQKDINISNAGIGTASHLCGLLLMSRLDLALTSISYKGAAPAMTDLQGGQVDLLCDQITTTLQPITSNRIKPYGSTTKKRLTALPSVPTLSEQGLSDFEITVWHGIYAPKGVPKVISDKLVNSLKTALSDPTFKENMNKLGAIPVEDDRASPQGLAKKLNDQINVWTPVIQKAEVYLQ